jgi:hypothetical protein
LVDEIDGCLGTENVDFVVFHLNHGKHVRSNQLGDKFMPKIIEIIGEKKAKKQKIFMVAATLRAETMCGQTNCYILPEGEFSMIQMKNNEIYILGAQAAINLVYQEKALTIEDFESEYLSSSPSNTTLCLMGFCL